MVKIDIEQFNNWRLANTKTTAAPHSKSYVIRPDTENQSHGETCVYVKNAEGLHMNVPIRFIDPGL